MTDYYSTLGVARNATPDDIKKAYRRLAGIHHPDKGGDTAMFQKVQEAYETLSDPEKKQQYDNPNPFGQGMHGGFHGGFPGGFSFHTQGFDINDIFGQMFGHRGGGFKPQPPSYRTTIFVSLEQVYNGGEQMLQFQSISGNQTVKIQIPRGVEDGATLRYDNLIKDSILIAEFRIHQHHKFQRMGQNLQSVQEVSIFDLIVGGSFEFDTISGKKVEVTIPPKSQPGNILRLSGEGLPNNNGFGDQMILLKPTIPDIIDSRIIDSINLYKGN
jgi:molecular chaperone DnaJ